MLVVLTAGIAGLIVFSKLRSRPEARVVATPPTEPAVPVGKKAPPANASAESVPPAPAARQGQATTATPAPGTGAMPSTQQARITPLISVPPSILAAPTNEPAEFELKPLPVLEKDYTATTNRDQRLDIMMDIAETPGAEAVKALTRLFEVETDLDLKVDLLDSLLGIEGFKDDKLIMLTLGARQGLPSEVRQSAIDGLIDLDDQRVIPILNGLLNDPDAEIREAAKDAIEMLQSQPAVQPK
jgi:HEAT repeat protein